VIVVVIALALSVQCYASNKYLGFFFTLVPLLIIPILFGYLEWSNSLNEFNSSGLSKPYSDMNGYGGRYIQWPFYRVYWYSISAFLCLIALIVYPRGKEKSFISRWKLSRYFNNKQFKFNIAIPVCIAIVAGFFIYYQEYILERWFHNDAIGSLVAKHL
jgi:ABC-2 type transport system permease protein